MGVMLLHRPQADLAPLREAVRRAGAALEGMNLTLIRGQTVRTDDYRAQAEALVGAVAAHVSELTFPVQAEVLTGDPHAHTSGGGLAGLRSQWSAPRAMGGWCAEDLSVYLGIWPRMQPFETLPHVTAPVIQPSIEPHPDESSDHHALWSRTFGQTRVTLELATATARQLMPGTSSGQASDELRLALTVRELLSSKPLDDIRSDEMTRAAFAWTGQGFSAARALFRAEGQARGGTITVGNQASTRLHVWAALGGAELLHALVTNLDLTRGDHKGALSPRKLLGLDDSKHKSTPQADVIRVALRSISDRRSRQDHQLINESNCHAPMWQVQRSPALKLDENTHLCLLRDPEVRVVGANLALARDLAQGLIAPTLRPQGLSEATTAALTQNAQSSWLFGTLLSPLHERTTLKGARARTLAEMIAVRDEMKLPPGLKVYLAACGPALNSPLSGAQRELLNLQVSEHELTDPHSHEDEPSLELINRGELNLLRRTLAREGTLDLPSCRAHADLDWLSRHPQLGDTETRAEVQRHLLMIREGWNIHWKKSEYSSEVQLQDGPPPAQRNWSVPAQHLALLAQAARAAPLHRRMAERGAPPEWLNNNRPTRLGAFIPPRPGEIAPETVLKVLNGEAISPELTARVALLATQGLTKSNGSYYESEERMLSGVAQTLSELNVKGVKKPDIHSHPWPEQPAWLTIATVQD